MNEKNKKYNNLDISFEQEKNSIEEKSRKMMEVLDNIYPAKKSSFKQKHIKVSITIPENDSEFLRILRGKISDPNADFFPTRSDLFRAGVELLKKTKTEDVAKIVKSF